MSTNSQPLSGNITTPLQLVGLNTLSTNLVLDAENGNSSFTVQTGSNTSLYIDKYSNVGINTKSPGAQLEVASANGACLRLRYGTSTTAYANIFMTNTGDLAINPTGDITTTGSLDLAGHDGSTTGLKLAGALVTATANQLNYLAVTAGTAAASKAVVLDSALSVTGINLISATSFKLGSNTLTATEAGYLTGVTAGTASNGKALVLSSTGNITGITSISATTVILNGADITTTINSTGYLSGITEGQAAANKALVLNSSKNITGVGSIGLTSVVFGSTTIGETQVGYISSVTPGTAGLNKALITDASGNISGIASLSATSLTGLIQTAAQPNITSVGTLTSLTTSGNITLSGAAAYLSIANTAASTSSTTGALRCSGGAYFGGNSYFAGTITGTMASGSQTNITSVGSLTSLTVSGNFNSSNTGYNVNINNTSASSGSTSGALRCSGGAYFGNNCYFPANVTIAGNLSSGGIISGYALSAGSGGISGTLTTSSQGYITSLGTLTSLTCSGAGSFSSLTVNGTVITGGGGGNITGTTLTNITKIGIGTSSPGFNLHVVSSTGNYSTYNPQYKIAYGNYSSFSTGYSGINWSVLSAFFQGSILISFYLGISSDIRIKKNIEPISSFFAKTFVTTVNPVQYQLKNNPNNDTTYGFIAQDLIHKQYTDFVYILPQKGIEELIDDNGLVSPKDTIFNLNYNSIMSVLMKSQKDTLNDIDNIETKTNELESEVAQLQEQVTQLLKMLA